MILPALVEPGQRERPRYPVKGGGAVGVRRREGVRSESSWSARAWSCSLWGSLIAAATSLRNASVVASSSRTYKRSGLFKKAPLPDRNVQGACPADENDPRQLELTGACCWWA